MPEELVGAAEVAQMLGVVRQYVHRLSQEDPTFPRPVAELAAGRVWKRADIEKWAKATGRAIQG
jgi:predicted DNA-binding transcriptional regulator AlpA